MRNEITVETSEVLNLLADGPKEIREIFNLSSTPTNTLAKEIGRLVQSGLVSKVGTVLTSNLPPVKVSEPVDPAMDMIRRLQAVSLRSPIRTMTDSYDWTNQ